MNKYKKYKRRAFLQRQSFRFNANLHRLRCRRIVIEAILREKRHQGFQKRKLEKEQKKAAKHPISLTVPQDFRLLVNPQECTQFFRSLQKMENAYRLSGDFLQLNLEMSDIEDIDFAAVMMLESICEDLSHVNCNVHGNSPKNKEALLFLHDAGFYNMKFDKYGRKILDPGNRHIIEIQMGQQKILISNIMSFIELMDKTKKHIGANECLYVNNYIAILKEICGNSTEWGHNVRRNWTVAAKFEEHQVQFVALDLGQGIIKSLSKRFKTKMQDFFSNKSSAEVLRAVFEEYYGSKSKDPNRNQGLPLIKRCSESHIIKDLVVLSNNALVDFNEKSYDLTFDKNNKGLKGTLYSWSVDMNCLNSKLQ